MKQHQIRYILYNIFKALIWLSVFAVVYILLEEYVDIDYLDRLQPIINNEILILSIFLVSEVVVGIIPPEVFIIWALRNDHLGEFISLIAILTIISYLAGIAGYFIGHNLNRSLYFRFIKRRFLSKLDNQLQTFGIYLIVIAALTPVPFSGVSMLIGSVRFPFKRFALFALSRLLRFIVYAFIFWKLDPNI